MISIRKYLDTRGNRTAVAGDEPEPDAAAAAQDSPGPDYPVLYAGLLDHIAVHILTGEGAADLRSRLARNRARVRPGLSSEEGSGIDTAVRGILARHAARTQETEQRTALEMQHMVGVLNQALTVVAGGGERSVSRLQKIQGALHRASSMQDMAGLRASLSDAVQMVHEEARQERETAARDLATFGTEVARVRELVRGNAAGGLPAREAGAEALRNALEVSGPGECLLLVAFVFSQLQGIVQRYGPDVVDELFFQLIRERIQPLAPSSVAFRWTPFSLVNLVRGGPDPDRLKDSLLALNRAPLVHRVSLGNRTAVLKVGLAHLILDARAGDAAALTAELDVFTGAGSYKE